MRALTIILFSLVLNLGNAQVDFIQNRFKSCKEAEKKAIEQSEEDILFYTINEYPDSNQEYNFFINLLLYSNYNIQIKLGGCFDNLIDSCYSNKMNEIIETKYGGNILEQLRNKYEEEYYNFSNEKKYSMIDSDKFYPQHYLAMESLTKFIGNDKEFHKLIVSNLDFKKTNDDYQFVDFYINKQGEVINFETNLNYKSQKNLLLEKFNSIGKWVSGYLFNNKVNSIVTINSYNYN